MKRNTVIVRQTPSNDLWSGLLKLDAVAALLNEMAMGQDERGDGTSSKVYWSLYYTRRVAAR